jgi:hypothetical protein
MKSRVVMASLFARPNGQRIGLTAPIGAALVALGLLVTPAAAWATSIPLPDPLHGYCAGAGQCIDSGTNSPTSTNPPSNFGFTVSPGPASGDLLIDILVPDNEDPLSVRSGTFALTGTLAGTATLLGPTAWSTGDLDTYMSIDASPSNPIGAFLPSTVAVGVDPGATGFFVYQVDLGTATLQGASDPNLSPLETLSTGVPVGSYIVGFLNEGTATSPDWIATANSGAIFETGDCSVNCGPIHPPFSTAPEPATLVLLGTGLAALSVRLRKRAGSTATPRRQR